MEKPTKNNLFEKFEQKYLAPTLTAIVGAVIVLLISSDVDKLTPILTFLQYIWLQIFKFLNINLSLGWILLGLGGLILLLKYLPKKILIKFLHHRLNTSNLNNLEKVNQELIQTREDLKKLSAELSNANQENTKNIEMLREIEDKHSKLKQLYKSVVTANEQAQERIGELVGELKQKETELIQTKEQHIYARNQILFLEPSYNKLSNQVEELKSTLTQKTFDHERTKKEYAEILAAMEEKNKLLEEVKKQLEDTKSKLSITIQRHDEVIKHRKNQQKEYNKLVGKLNQRQDEFEQTKKKYDDMSVQLELKTKSLDQANQKILELNQPVYSLLVKYHGVNLTDSWSEEYRPVKYKERERYGQEQICYLKLNQQVDEITGDALFTDDEDVIKKINKRDPERKDYKGVGRREFNIKGRILNGYVSLELVPKDEKIIGIINYLLKVTGEGKILEGYTCYYNSEKKDIISAARSVWTRI